MLSQARRLGCKAQRSLASLLMVAGLVSPAYGAAVASDGRADPTNLPRLDAYRERVIESAGDLSDEGPGTARTAYMAVDRGGDSYEAKALGGLAQAHQWVDRFEFFHEYALLRTCVEGVLATSDLAGLSASIVTSEHLPPLLADAERLADDEYRQLLAEMEPAPSDAARAEAAIRALLMRGMKAEAGGSQKLTALAMMRMASGTKDVCVASPKLTSLTSNLP